MKTNRKFFKIAVSFLFSPQIIASLAYTSDKAEEHCDEVEYAPLIFPTQTHVMQNAVDGKTLSGFSVNIDRRTPTSFPQHSPIVTLQEHNNPIRLEIKLTYHTPREGDTYNLSKVLPGNNLSHIKIEGFWSSEQDRKTSTSSESKVFIQKNPILIQEPTAGEEAFDSIAIPLREEVFEAFNQGITVDGFTMKKNYMDETSHPSLDYHGMFPCIDTVQKGPDTLLTITYYDIVNKRLIILSRDIKDTTKEALKFQSIWRTNHGGERVQGTRDTLLSPTKKPPSSTRRWP